MQYSNKKQEKTFCGIEKLLHRNIQIRAESKLKNNMTIIKKVFSNILKLDKLFFDLYYLDQKETYDVLISQNNEMKENIKTCLLFSSEKQSLVMQIFNKHKALFLAKKYLRNNNNNLSFLLKKLPEEYHNCISHIIEITQSQIINIDKYM